MLLQYLFMKAIRSNLPNGARNVPIDGPVHLGTGTPLGVPVVVFGAGTGSY